MRLSAGSSDGPFGTAHERITQLANSEQFDYVLVESTGISEPLPVAAGFFADFFLLARLSFVLAFRLAAWFALSMSRISSCISVVTVVIRDRRSV